MVGANSCWTTAYNTSSLSHFARTLFCDTFKGAEHPREGNMFDITNGKAEVVVQEAEAYQHLLDIAAHADAAEGIRQGLEDVEKGRVRPARDRSTGIFTPRIPCRLN